MTAGLATTATPGPPTDLVALHEALSSAVLAAFIAEGGDGPECVREAITEARLTAAGAFPEGGGAYEAFGVVLNAITDAMAVPA
jgi:hypothetical protein